MMATNAALKGFPMPSAGMNPLFVLQPILTACAELLKAKLFALRVSYCITAANPAGVPQRAESQYRFDTSELILVLYMIANVM